MDGEKVNMITIRIGEGRSKYGKILDRDTEWYTDSEKDDAIKCAMNTGKKIYISENRSPFKEITLQELKEL